MSAELELRGVTAGYGEVTVLHDVSLTVAKGRLTSLVGANGAGKTTLLRTAAGLVIPAEGRVFFRGEDVTREPAHVRARKGIALVPEGRQLFASMTVRENLELGATPLRDKPVEIAHNLARAFELFPRLREREQQRAGTLSGGEQQMVAVARRLMASPAVLMFDELSLGLSPTLTRSLFETLRTLGPRVLLDALPLALDFKNYREYELACGIPKLQDKVRSELDGQHLVLSGLHYAHGRVRRHLDVEEELDKLWRNGRIRAEQFDQAVML